jgi:hypothetical protein
MRYGDVRRNVSAAGAMLGAESLEHRLPKHQGRCRLPGDWQPGRQDAALVPAACSHIATLPDHLPIGMVGNRLLVYRNDGMETIM